MKPASDKLNEKLFREMSTISVVFDALKNISASPENSFREMITREKSMLLREVGIWPESLLWERTIDGALPGKWPKESGIGPESWLRLRLISSICGRDERDAGMVPESLLKERLRNQRFLRFARNGGTGPEMLFQLSSRVTRFTNFPIAGGIFPTRKGFLRRRSLRRNVKFATTSGIVPLS